MNMAEYSELLADYEQELSDLNDAIDECKTRLTELEEQRRELLPKIRYIDMGIILEVIEEYGLSSKDMLQMITTTARKREPKQ